MARTERGRYHFTINDNAGDMIEKMCDLLGLDLQRWSDPAQRYPQMANPGWPEEH